MENCEVVDQKPPVLRQRVLDWIAANNATFARQGTVVESWRIYQGRRLGPYFRLACRVSGKQRSIYLGTDIELANEVRGLLAALQSPHHQRQELARARTAIKNSLAAEKEELRRQLAQVGLHLKGFEIRGMRTSLRSPLTPETRG